MLCVGSFLLKYCDLFLLIFFFFSIKSHAFFTVSINGSANEHISNYYKKLYNYVNISINRTNGF